MATLDSTPGTDFFPHLRSFVRACCPDALDDAQIARIEAGRLLPGETLYVLNLNALAEDWVRVRELLRTAWRPGVLQGLDLGATAWQLVRALRRALSEAEQASLEALRTAVPEPAEQCAGYASAQ
jgi:hypothetical protein